MMSYVIKGMLCKGFYPTIPLAFRFHVDGREQVGEGGLDPIVFHLRFLTHSVGQCDVT